MYVTNIELQNFINYSHANLEFSLKTNVIYGNNAQGKTNLLEALYLSSHAKSFKNAPIRELIKKDEKKAQVFLRFFSFGREKTLLFLFEKDNKRKIFLNDIEIKSPSRLLEHFKVVFFSPDDLLLIKKGPELRRRFLDQVISQMSPAYLSALLSYQKVMEQKNKLLKMIKDGKVSDETLFAWNKKIAEFMAIIILKRQEYLEKLQKKCQELHVDMTGQTINITYLPGISHIEETLDAERLKESIYSFLEEKKEVEKRAGQALYGTHRDDFLIFIDDMDTRRFASQGQQRTIALCLKLAQSECIKDEFSEYPLILLDDIMSELDKKRRQFLLSKLSGKQIMMTCTDKEAYKSEDIRYFYVEDGMASQEEQKSL